jgi:galactokinase
MGHRTVASAALGFERTYGRAPDGVWSAPGRVNLIGEHTDYNEGFVLPFAIQHRTAVAAGLSTGHAVRARSTLSEEPASAEIRAIAPGTVTGWGGYVLGVAWALTEQRGAYLTPAGTSVPGPSGPAPEPGRPRLPEGVDLFIDSDVPVGAGLSSSAALECAVACALDELWCLGHERTALALAGQRAENEVVGAPTGIMDQFASMLGREGAAVFLDCRSQSAELVPFGLGEAGLELVVIDTREHHAHATSGYAARRASCELAARLAGVRALRDLGTDDLPVLADLADEETYRRARHIVTENARVLESVEALRVAGPAAVGPLLTESHRSMRDDFEITTPALDLAVQASLGAGALGARMTGGGFGGAAIALVPLDAVARLQDQVLGAFANSGFNTPRISTVTPSDGARRDR